MATSFNARKVSRKPAGGGAGTRLGAMGEPPPDETERAPEEARNRGEESKAKASRAVQPSSRPLRFRSRGAETNGTGARYDGRARQPLSSVITVGHTGLKESDQSETDLIV